MNKVIENIKNRRTIRRFKEEQVKDSDLMEILECGNYAPSGHNMQPWHFTVIQDLDLIKEIEDSIKEVGKNFEDKFIQEISNNPKFRVFYGAPTVIVASYKEGAVTPKEDLSAAVQNMLLGANSLDLGTCWIGLINLIIHGEGNREWAKKLGVPEGHLIGQCVALGYPDMEPATPIRKQEYYNIIK